MIHLLISRPNNLPKNIGSIEKIIVQNSLDEITELKFCSICSMSIGETQICENNTCQNFNIIAKNYDSFHSVGITKQLNHIIKKNYNSISKYLSDSQRCSYDIIDGSQYQTQTGTLNLLTYTDGIQIYKSTAKKSCVWPVYVI